MPKSTTYLNTQNTGERYWFGFNGQESENEIWGEGNASFYKYRISDNRLGRFFSVDPLAAQYPHNSTYAFSENRVIDGVELEGLEFQHYPQQYNPFAVLESVWNYFVKEPVEKVDKFQKSEAGQITTNVAKIAAGVLCIVAAVPTGGGSLTVLGALGVSFGVTVGNYQIISGISKISVVLADKNEIAEKIPSGYLNATVGMTVKTMVDDEAVTDYMEFTLTIIEGAATFKFSNPTEMQKFSNIINSSSMVIESIEVIEKNNDIQENE